MNRMLVPLYRSIAYNYRQGGLTLLMQKALSRCACALHESRCWLIYSSDVSAVGSERRTDTRLRELTFDDLLRFSFFKAVGYPEVIKNRFARREICYGYFVGTELAHVAWLTQGYLFLDSGVPEVIREQCAGIYDCYTLPAFRRQGVYREVLRALQAASCRMQKKVCLIAVDPRNHASKNAIEQVGFTLAQTATYTRTLRKPVLHLEPAG